MQTAKRRLTIGAVVISVAVHVVVLAILALHAPVLRVPLEPAGPPEAVIPVLMLPRTPPVASGSGVRPAPIQLHRRPQPNLPPALPVAPLVAPERRPPEPPSAPPLPAAPIAPPTVTSENVRSALRTTFGCSDAQMMNLSPSERARCLESLGQGARDAPFLPPSLGLSPGKRAAFDKAAAAKEAQKAAADRPAPAASATPAMPEASTYDGEPYIAGGGTSAIGPVQHPPSKRAAQKLQPLPP
jgi:hypothetical protein